MNLLAVSDLHLNPSTTERSQFFLRFLEAACENRDEVLIVGDLFDLWLGHEHLIFPYQVPIVAKMSDLVARGLIIYYVEGNRDFAIGSYLHRVFREVRDISFSKQWGSRTVFAEHGDLINLDDRQYRLWRRISKSRFSFFMFRHLPASILLRLAAYLEKRMKPTNLKYKIQYPEKYCKKFYEEKFEKGMDIVIVGHFHEEREVTATRNGKNVLFYNLPGWESGFRYLIIPQNGEKPHFAELG